jgi:hypothetical protein
MSVFARRVCFTMIAGSALAMPVLTGCGTNGPQRAAVSGAVTYRGKPVALGQIRFVPKPGTEAPVSGAEIHDGKYEVLKGGVPVGTHRVEILGHRSLQPGVDPAQAIGGPNLGPAMEQYIPPKYNAATQLEMTIAPGSGKITKDFNLTD